MHEDAKVPPQDLDAEGAVLGSLLLSRDAADLVMQKLTPDHFYKKANGLIYEVLLELQAANQPLDQVIVKGALQRKGLLEQVGGVAYLSELADAVPTARNAEYYAKFVEEKALLRGLIGATVEIQQEAYSANRTAHEILDAAERRVLEVTERRVTRSAEPISTAIIEVFDHIDKVKEGKDRRGVLSRFAKLDDMTHGFHPGEITILAARPSMGKTSLALSILRNVCVWDQKPAALFSLEMPKMQVATNLLCNIARVDSNLVRGAFFRQDQMKKMVDAAELLSSAPLYIDDSPTLTTMELRAKARRLHNQKGIEFLIIDYLQLMTASSLTAQREGRQVEVTEISRMIKSLARELEIPIIALAQLSRKVEDRPDRKPRMSDLRESGSIEQDADLILLLFREEYYKRDDESLKGLAQVIIAKNRNGPTGELPVRFQKEFTRFDNLAEDN